MGRREFIALLGSTAAVWPLTVRAEQRKVPTIGVLDHMSREQYGLVTASY
jgi:hypothetical protein